MILSINIDNNLDCALFKYKKSGKGTEVPKEDIIYRGKVKNLQKAIKKIPNGEYNIAVVNKDNTLQFGLLIKRTNKVNNLLFE